MNLLEFFFEEEAAWLHGCKTFWLQHTTEVIEEDKESVSKE